MASVISIDDDDGFDWDAAVREIDLACQNLNTSTSHPNGSAFQFPNGETHLQNQAHPSSSCIGNQKKVGTSRQSTLDKFVTLAPPRPPVENYIVSDRVEEGCFDDGRCFVDIDPEAAKNWIYPTNIPCRDYQFDITKKALFSNTLVALPTGLGKTLIAAVVMYNYFRWFPEGKIVFAAPSRPLVMQQIEACHKVVGIPQEWTIDMTGQTNPTKRADLWKSKRVFFVTPQVLERDIQSGTCLVKYLVCLVIDEAHRAMGNYSYCVVVRELMAVPVQLRILALTATPGSKQQVIQCVIDNLLISALEYRDENDPDVSPYVHDRKIELIQVAMGKDAVEINNKLLDVIKPYASKLLNAGVIQNREYHTLSPCDLLNSRERFRQAPPQNLPQNKYDEVEKSFAALITMYHIRKLLSSHGIRPAYEMLEEKLKQGYFAKAMSRNEDIMQAKLMMQRNLSHGTPNPKLSKMLEVLVDHFKQLQSLRRASGLRDTTLKLVMIDKKRFLDPLIMIHEPMRSLSIPLHRIEIEQMFYYENHYALNQESKDPQNSRVIIFSNFRGSVRDIMDALAHIGKLVKATEFIGQSSGKTLKGQSQKVQQAVLEKFRAGAYNVIVATSIGEEGLDIMEVDLVICFDANVSPLRMIQRMGRTGRKHNGRVVVLACDGSEMKGYMRKQSTNKTVRKHMHNGGVNSFNFHPSPRMIPHIFKPEPHLVEFAIDNFVPRGKKPKEDNAVETTPVVLNKLTDTENSLIAKYFQSNGGSTWKPSLIAFPSSQSVPSRVHRVMHSARAGMLIDSMQHLQGLFFSRTKETLLDENKTFLGQCLVDESDGEDAGKDPLYFDHIHDEQSERETSDCEASPRGVLKDEKCSVPEIRAHNPPVHSYLFGSDFVSVSELGQVLIRYVPSLPFKEIPSLNDSNALENCLERDSCHLKTSDSLAKAISGLETCQTKCTVNVTAALSESSQERTLREFERIPETPISKRIKQADDDYGDGFRDFELSPRLTNFIESGVVPESPPVNDVNQHSSPKWQSSAKGRSLFLEVEPCAEQQKPYSSPQQKENVTETNILVSPNVEKTRTPLTNLGNNSCSSEWRLSSEDKSESVEKPRKLKRLRKIGDREKSRSLQSIKETSVVAMRNSPGSSPVRNKNGKKKRSDDARVFIEEEAEVSSEAELSGDDEDGLDDNSYEDSFIDDRVNPSVASTQADSSRTDMMAVYRRSLLSQSPMVRLPACYATNSPDSVALTRASEASGSSSSGKTPYTLHTPQIASTDHFHVENSESSPRNTNKTGSEAIPGTFNISPGENEGMIETRKRKLSFFQPGSIPRVNLEQEFMFESRNDEKEPLQQVQGEKTESVEDLFSDDLFYEGLDLDAIEEEAKLLLEQRAEMASQKPQLTSAQNGQQHFGNMEFDAPSFDLGF